MTFECRDVLVDRLPSGFDVVTCSLFLHHLDEAQAVALLFNMAAATRYLLLVSDLRPELANWFLAGVASRVLTRSPVVHADAVRSVRAAFRSDEALGLAQRAGLPAARVRQRWPFRWVLEWQR